jgi:hypothetical protein
MPGVQGPMPVGHGIGVPVPGIMVPHGIGVPIPGIVVGHGIGSPPPGVPVELGGGGATAASLRLAAAPLAEGPMKAATRMHSIPSRPSSVQFRLRCRMTFTRFQGNPLQRVRDDTTGSGAVYRGVSARRPLPAGWSIAPRGHADGTPRDTGATIGQTGSGRTLHPARPALKEHGAIEKQWRRGTWHWLGTDKRRSAL